MTDGMDPALIHVHISLIRPLGTFSNPDDIAALVRASGAALSKGGGGAGSRRASLAVTPRGVGGGSRDVEKEAEDPLATGSEEGAAAASGGGGGGGAGGGKDNVGDRCVVLADLEAIAAAGGGGGATGRRRSGGTVPQVCGMWILGRLSKR